jgi:hypothetical protein
MEDNGILGRRRWSTVRRAQVTAAVAGACLSLTVILLGKLDLWPSPHSRAGYYLFALGIMTHGLAAKTGLSDGAPVWQWNGLSLLLNTLFCFLLGTAIGWLLKPVGAGVRVLRKSGALNWRAWSAMRKAQAASALIGALVTLIASVISRTDVIQPPYSTATYLLFCFCLAAQAPARLLGFSEEAPDWAWYVLPLFVNTFLCLLVATTSASLFRTLRRSKSTVL